MEQNKEKTALTWFLDEVLLKQVFSMLPPINMKEWDKIVQMTNKAKEMEKAQHRETFHAGFWVKEWDKTKEDKFEDYFNQTYGTKS